MKNYDNRCDIWSAGIIMYILLSGNQPFNGSSLKEILSKIQEGKINYKHPIWKMISAEARDLLNKMLTYDYTKRITGPECL